MPLLSARLALVGLVVFLANAGLLVLQLVAGRLLAPFLGSSLETWTSIIASFLIGIAVGNAVGGRIANRSPRPGKLIQFLFLGVLAALWMIGFPELLKLGSSYTSIPLVARIPLLSLVLCVPVAFVLSLLTPLAIRIGMSGVEGTGRVAGLVFGPDSLGCLLGNYLTGFVLIPEFTINAIVLGVAGLLAVVALCVLGLTTAMNSPLPSAVPPPPSLLHSPSILSLRSGFAIVFLCSFAGMTLELSATRLLARDIGVSIYTWTGVIGVMLLGTSLGNALGGWLADRSARRPDPNARSIHLGWTLIASGILSVLVIAVYAVLVNYDRIGELDLVAQILIYTFAIFFLPMMLLGMVSPQVIRLCVTDVGGAGRTAGRVYAVSTLGAIVGTLATGYALISSLGVMSAILIAGLFPLAAILLIKAHSGKLLLLESSVMLYAFSAAMGAVLGGFILKSSLSKGVTAESNYYTIIVAGDPENYFVEPPTEALAAVVGNWGVDTKLQKMKSKPSYVRTLRLDQLTHSQVDLTDPTYLYYRHEKIQVEMVLGELDRSPTGTKVLVIGGGGYTFPRYVRTQLPAVAVDVVEIDPGVTKVAFEHLGLKKEWGINIHHMDGRQFVAEKATPGDYRLVTLDAVNDFSVPSHLLTKECNDAVKRTLVPEGVYLVTVIDLVDKGLLWKATYRTLQKSFAYVELLYPEADFLNTVDYLTKLRKAELKEKGVPEQSWNVKVSVADVFQALPRSVLVIYASDRPLDPEKLNSIVMAKTEKPSDVYVVPKGEVDEMLKSAKPVILTDQYAPTDDLMRQVFKTRKEKKLSE